MKPTRLSLRHFRSFESLDLDLPEGCVGISGPNGAGKSSLIEAIEVALFGPSGRSLEPYVSEGEDELEVVLDFDHGDARYRIRRQWTRRKTTLDFERLAERVSIEGRTIDLAPTVLAPGMWQPLTRETIAETQVQIEAILGLTRETFRSSAYLAQGDSAAFSTAPPAKRKELLADVLALDLWEKAAAAVASDRSHAQSAVSEADGRIAFLEERSGSWDALEQERAAEETIVATFEEHLAAAETRVAAAEDALRAHELAEASWRAEVTQAQAALAVGQANRASVMREIEEAEADARRTRDGHLSEAGRLIGEAERTERQMNELEAARRALLKDIAALNEDEAHCPTCGQAVAAEAKERAQAVLQASLAEKAERIETLQAEHAALRERIAQAERAAQEIEDPQPSEEQVARLESCEQEIADAQRSLDAIEAPRTEAVEDAKRTLAAERTHVERARRSLADARETLAATEARLEQVKSLAAELAACRSERERLNAELEQLLILERAFGRDGVPAWIVEQRALPQIEDEANRVLADLGGLVSRVELRTERELKSGGTREALDVICHSPEGPRPYETFSGGERACVDVALRLGLARLLAHRRGAEVRMLCLDEPYGLDEQRMPALVGVLRDLTARGEFDAVYLASHDPLLREAFDASLVVERNGGGSEVAVA